MVVNGELSMVLASTEYKHLDTIEERKPQQQPLSPTP